MLSAGGAIAWLPYAVAWCPMAALRAVCGAAPSNFVLSFPGFARRMNGRASARELFRVKFCYRLGQR